MGEIQFMELRRETLHMVRDIYNYYIKNTTYTFHRIPLTVSDLAKFIPLNDVKYKSFLIHLHENQNDNQNDKQGQQHDNQHEDEICGYCYLSQYKKREAYDGTVEMSIYLKPEYTKKGIGAQAFRFLENIAQDQQFNTILSFVSGDNPTSMKFFKNMGFEQCGHFKKVGMKFGKLLDVYVFQKMLV